ncbi:MAG: YfhO family protein [Thermodesulfobacteriota bacterium]
MAAAWVAGLVLAVALLDSSAFIARARTVTGRADNASFNFPIRVEVARQWREGRLPLWNPYNFSGFPLLGDITSGALYPGNLPFLLEPIGLRYRALDRVAALHFVLAGLFMYVFARSLSLGRAAASLAGLVYAGNGLLLFFAIRWIQAQNAAAWLPLILAAVQRAAVPGEFRRWTAIGAAAVALQTLSGYPQYGFYTGLMAGTFALVLTVGRREDRFRPVWSLLSIYVLGIALAAVQLLPAIEIAALSRRGSGVSLEEFLLLPSSPNVLPGLVIPRLVTSPMYPYFLGGAVFVGTLAVVLAIEGARSTGRVQLFLTGAFVVTLVLALGPFTPVGQLAYAIPGLNAFRYPFKHLLEVVFCLAALAGFGAQSLLDGRRGARACVAIGGSAVACWIIARLATGTARHWVLVVTAVGVPVFVALVLLQRRRVAVAVALALVWLGLAGNRGAVFGLAGRTRSEPPRVVDTLARRNPSILGPRYASVVPQHDRRKDQHALLALDYPTEFRIPSVNGTSPFLWAPYQKALTMSEDGHFGMPRLTLGAADQTLDVLGVRFVGSAGKAVDGNVIHEEAKAVVVERATALPPLRFVDRARCMNGEEIFRELHRRYYKLSSFALLECEGKPALPRIAPASQRSQISLLNAEPGFLRMRVELSGSAPGVLVVSQSDMPGWRARIDGGRAPIYRAYGLVQALVVPAGLHEVELEYRPDSLIAGAWISLAALAAVLVVGASGYRRDRRGPA